MISRTMRRQTAGGSISRRSIQFRTSGRSRADRRFSSTRSANQRKYWESLRCVMANHRAFPQNGPSAKWPIKKTGRGYASRGSASLAPTPLRSVSIPIKGVNSQQVQRWLQSRTPVRLPSRERRERENIRLATCRTIGAGPYFWRKVKLLIGDGLAPKSIGPHSNLGPPSALNSCVLNGITQYFPTAYKIELLLHML